MRTHLDNRVVLVLVALAPPSALLFLVWPAWSAWFAVDDTAVILCAQYGTLDLLIDRPTANFCNPLFFTPLWPILFKLDSQIWALNPEGYRLVNLILAMGTLAMLWVLLRPRVGSQAAWIAVMLLAVSLPLAFGVGWITRRHYITGLWLAMLAIWLLLRFIERPEKPRPDVGYAWLLGSITAYFLAILSKEAYAFLPALLFPLAAIGIRRRVWIILPYGLALGLYLLWRGWMLGGLGGYPTTDLALTELTVRGWEQLTALPGVLFGSAAPLLLVPGLLLLVRAPKEGLFILFAALASLSPYLLYPSAGFDHASKAFAASALVATGCGMAWAKTAAFPRLRLILGLSVGGLVLGSVSASSAAIERVSSMGEQFSARYQAIASSSADPVLVLGDFPYYFSAINRLHALFETGQERDLDAVSSSLALPLFADRPYKRVVLQDGRAFDGAEAQRFLASEVAVQLANRRLASPDIQAVRTERAIRFESRVDAGERVVRCLIRANYANCTEVGARYVMPYPTRIPIVSVVFHRVLADWISPPTVVNPERVNAKH